MNAATAAQLTIDTRVWRMPRTGWTIERGTVLKVDRAKVRVAWDNGKVSTVAARTLELDTSGIGVEKNGIP